MIALTRCAIRKIIREGVIVSIEEALKNHRRAGHSVVVWRNNRIQRLKPGEIFRKRKFLEKKMKTH